MELRIALTPDDLDRFRSHSTLRAFKRGRPRNSVETGKSLRLAHSLYELGGGSWNAEMKTSRGECDGHPVSTISFCLREGPPAPLCALLQAMAEAVPFSVDVGQVEACAPVKGDPPHLHRDMEAGEAFRLIAASAIAHLSGNTGYLRRTGDPEAVHQMRVAVRRLRAAMTMFKPLLGDPVSQSLRTELRWLQEVLGSARDWDVLLADTVAPLKDVFGDAPGYDGLCRLIERCRQKARSAALKELSTPRLTRLMLQLSFWAEGAAGGQDLSDRPIADLARAILDKRFRKIRKTIPHLHELSPEERHKCRIDIKKLRYAVDFFSSLFHAKHAKRLGALLAAMQDKLGALNDTATAKTRLGELVRKEGGLDIAWTAGQVMGWHTARFPALLSEVHDHWHAVEKLHAFWREKT